MSGRLPPGTGWRPSRRTSFARRDSNLALIGAMFSGVVIASGIILLLMARINPEQGTLLRGAAADLLRPLHAIVMAPFRLVGVAGDAVGDHWQAVRHVRAMETELEAARRTVARAERLAGDLAALEKLVAMQRPERRVVAMAAASVSPATANARTAIIGAGHNHGVRPRMPVIGPGGLVGRTMDVGFGAARVLLITDANSRVPVVVQRNGWTGIAVGRGTHLLEFQFDAQSGNDRLQPGDQLLTSGDGGLFPPGIPVGTIVDAAAEPPTIRPSVNPASIGPVMVEAPWLPPPEPMPVADALPEADLVPSPPPAPADPAVPPPANSPAVSPVPVQATG